MAGFALNLSGMENLTKMLKTIEDDLTKGVAEEISASTMKIEKDAKRNAPVNIGTLRQSIHGESTLNGMTGKVIVDASYGAYVEFGTGGKVKIPAGYEEFAGQFRGKSGGSLEEFIKALTLWVKRKGLAGTYMATAYSLSTRQATKIKRFGTRKQRASEDEKLARFLAIKILKNGIRPQPFLIPAYEEEKPKLFNRLKRLLNAKS